MKKVGIITYHFAQNYGAVLQCYALSEFLTNKGYDVTVFDFVSETQRKNNDIIKHGYNIKTFIKNICLLPFRKSIKKKYDRFSEFRKVNLRLSPRFSKIEELKAYIEENELDYIISGSDQVLNPNIPDFDKAFLYPFKTKAKKIAYAASTGNASAQEIETIKSYLDDFSYISIREQKDLNKFVGGSVDKNRYSVVCDPVMLLPEEKWKNLIKKDNEKPYLVCYFLHKNLFSVEFNAAKNIANELGVEMKVINARFSSKSFLHGTVLDVGPKEFVNLIANACYVCTDSFHGTLFSLLFHKRFSCFDTRKNKHDTRKKGLLERVGAISAFQNIEESIKVCTEFDYKKIDRNIEEMRAESISFLQNLKK